MKKYKSSLWPSTLMAAVAATLLWPVSLQAGAAGASSLVLNEDRCPLTFSPVDINSACDGNWACTLQFSGFVAESLVACLGCTFDYKVVQTCTKVNPPPLPGTVPDVRIDSLDVDDEWDCNDGVNYFMECPAIAGGGTSWEIENSCGSCPD